MNMCIWMYQEFKQRFWGKIVWNFILKQIPVSEKIKPEVKLTCVDEINIVIASQQWVSVIHCLTQTYIDFLCTQVNVGQKQWENILSLPTTEFSEILKSGTKEVQHIIGSVNYMYHRNDFWGLKIGWNLTTIIDLMSTNPSILVYAHGKFPFTHHWL